MKFSDNQLFYAALYWTEALPNGEAFSHDICSKHGKPYMPMNPPLQTHDNVRFSSKTSFEDEAKIMLTLESGVSRQESEAFFEAIYAFLKEGRQKKQQADSGLFLDFRANGHLRFPASVEYGLEQAGLRREILNPCALIWVHDNGQSFKWDLDGQKVEEINYPGRPDTGCRTLPGLTWENVSEATSIVVIEELYRLVPLEEGKTYKTFYRARDGSRWPFDEFVAEKGDVFTIMNGEVDGDLRDFTDEELIGGKDERVFGGLQTRAEDVAKFKVGYVDERHGSTIEETDDPRIVSMKFPPMRCIDVRERMQILYGWNFAIAEPGDKIVLNSSFQRVMHVPREKLESGRVRLITKGNPPSPPRASPGKNPGV